MSEKFCAHCEMNEFLAACSTAHTNPLELIKVLSDAQSAVIESFLENVTMMEVPSPTERH